jgi:hypothetical protein
LSWTFARGGGDPAVLKADAIVDSCSHEGVHGAWANLDDGFIEGPSTG